MPDVEEGFNITKPVSPHEVCNNAVMCERFQDFEADFP